LKQAAPNINKSLPSGWQTHPQTPKCANPRREKEKGRQGKNIERERELRKKAISHIKKNHNPRNKKKITKIKCPQWTSKKKEENSEGSWNEK